MRRAWSTRLLIVVAVVAMVAVACGSDDGGEVRDLGGDGSASASGSASGTGSASGIGSGSASATGSGSGSGTGAGVTGDLGGYTPVSDVTAHSEVVLDICAINELLAAEGDIDYDGIRDLYENGENSTNDDGSMRTIAGFARSAERSEPIWDDYVAYYGDPIWLDSFVMSAIDGGGPFQGEPDAVRRQGIQKGIQNQIMIAWMLHELVAALEKAGNGEFDPASGAPHNWDEGWAFYHGEAPACAPYSTADKRGENFGTGTAVNDALREQFTRGVEALVAGDAAVAAEASDEIIRQVAITYVQATIRYAHQMDGALAEGDQAAARVSQAEGWAFYRVIEPLVAEADPEAATAIAARFDLGAGAPEQGAGEAVETALASAYDGLGISASDIGELSG